MMKIEINRLLALIYHPVLGKMSKMLTDLQDCDIIYYFKTMQNTLQILAHSLTQFLQSIIH